MPVGMSTAEIAVMASYLVWNILVFFLYGADKRKARRGNWRVSEKTLLLSAVLMGGAGALLGMRVFRHKTKHIKFQVGVPLALILNVGVIYLGARYL